MNISRNMMLWIVIILLLVALFNLFQGSNVRSGREEVSYSQFSDYLETGPVSNVELQGDVVFIQLIVGRRLRTF